MDGPVEALELNKKRVLDFEGELQEKLKHIDVLERGMEQVNYDRKKWLDSLSLTDGVQYDLYAMNLDIFRARAELFSLNMQAVIIIITLKLEYIYHIHFILFYFNIHFHYVSKDIITLN